MLKLQDFTMYMAHLEPLDEKFGNVIGIWQCKGIIRTCHYQSWEMAIKKEILLMYLDIVAGLVKNIKLRDQA